MYMYIYVYVYVCSYMSVCRYIYMYLYVYIHIFIYKYIFIHIYIHIHAHTHTHPHTRTLTHTLSLTHYTCKHSYKQVRSFFCRRNRDGATVYSRERCNAPRFEARKYFNQLERAPENHGFRYCDLVVTWLYYLAFSIGEGIPKGFLHIFHTYIFVLLHICIILLYFPPKST